MQMGLGLSRKVLSILVLAIVVSSACYYYLQLQGSSQGDINVQQARSLIETNPNLVIVDVRTPEEFSTGYIEGAMNLCSECDAQLLLDILDPDDGILLYCRTGRRSANALRILRENGYEKVYNMVGGIEAWKNAGYPVAES
jgi:hydroxyacylglutathione hydrolase